MYAGLCVWHKSTFKIFNQTESLLDKMNLNNFDYLLKFINQERGVEYILHMKKFVHLFYKYHKKCIR